MLEDIARIIENIYLKKLYMYLNFIVKRETAFIIHSKYVHIKFQLLSERGKYTSLLKNMESGLRILKNELAGLETMLDDAIYVSDPW